MAVSYEVHLPISASHDTDCGIHSLRAHLCCRNRCGTGHNSSSGGSIWMLRNSTDAFLFLPEKRGEKKMSCPSTALWERLSDGRTARSDPLPCPSRSYSISIFCRQSADSVDLCTQSSHLLPKTEDSITSITFQLQECSRILPSSLSLVAHCAPRVRFQCGRPVRGGAAIHD